MAASRIIISYSAPTNFLASDQWIQLKSGLEAHLPLRSLQWKPSSATASSVAGPNATRASEELLPRSIPALDVDLVALETIKDEVSSQVPGSVIEKPVLNLYFFACDDNESYKATHRKVVKDWQALITNPTKRHQEWLVILVVRPAPTTSTASRLFSIRAGGLDKVKADINTEKKVDRCVELVWPILAGAGGADDGWRELVEKIKDGVMAGFESYVVNRREEISKSESQRQLPGWNFCTYFVLKESLASSFDGVGLLGDALGVYGELEASFIQALKERNLSWFGNLGGTQTGDDSRSILSTSSKPYQNLILANSITLFDFRIYLFAKQMALLGKMGELVEVLRKSKTFIVAFAAGLRDNERSFTAFFLESWIYSACLNVVLQCDRAMELMKESSNLPAAAYLAMYAATKGELIELARNQLDKMGVHLGFLDVVTPFSLCLPSSFDKPRFAKGEVLNSKITRPELVEVLANKEAFDRLYVKSTQDAIDSYVEGKRRKWALKLHGDLAAFDLMHGNFPTAHQTYASLPAHYGPPKHPWPPLETFVLARALDAHVKAGRERDRAWLENALAFLDALATGQAASLNDDAGIPSGEDATGKLSKGNSAYVEGLLRDVRTAAGELEEEIIKRNHAAFSMTVKDENAHLAEDEDGALVEMMVSNNLSAEVVVDTLSLDVGIEEMGTFVFSKSGPVTLNPGDNIVSLFCPDSHVGIFRILEGSLMMSKICFTWQYPSEVSEPSVDKGPSSASLIPSIEEGTKAFIRIPADKDSLDVVMVLPRVIQWDTPPSVLLTLKSGRNEIEEAVMRISGDSAGDLTAGIGSKFKMSDTELLEDSLGDDSMAFLEANEECITFKSLAPKQAMSFTIPYTSPQSGAFLQAAISVEYTVKSAKSESSSPHRRRFHAIRKVSTTLPIQVSVMDSFRGQTLISKFTISSTSHLQVRIRETKLGGADGTTELRIRSPLKTPQRAPTIVTPQRPANFLYQLEADSPRYERETLYFHVTYRTMREEIETRLESEIDLAFKDEPELVEPARTVLIESLAKEASWVQLYIHTGELDLSSQSLEGAGKEIAKKLQVVLENLRKPRTTTDLSDEETPDKEWHKLIIPVDVPFMHILCAVQIHLYDVDVNSIYAGQPVPARAEIKTSFHWGSVRTSATPEYRMRYVMQEAVNDWLVSGHKRGDFTAAEDGSHIVDLTLVPLHHGELALPSIAVSPLSTVPAGDGGEGMQNANSGLPSTETYHVQAAQRIMVLPRGGRSTFVVGMGGDM